MSRARVFPGRIPDDEFQGLRREVLRTWPTGAGVDLDDAVAYHLALPPHRNVARVLMGARSEGRTLIQPRGGVALLDEHIRLLKGFEEAGADLLPTTLDSYTRNNRYDAAERAIRESEQAGRSMLNGFPIVNYGVPGCRRVTEAVDRPLVGRPGACDARLAAEVAFAAGFGDFEGGPLDYFFAYSKDLPPERVVRDWQYIYRLAGWYQERGVDIHQEQYGAITGTLVPPCLGLSVVILEALTAAEQGVREVRAIAGLRPDMILLAGGTDGGDEAVHLLPVLIGTGGVFRYGVRADRILAGGLFDPDEPTVLRPRSPRCYVDAGYVLAAAGLLGESNPGAAVRLMRASPRPV